MAFADAILRDRKEQSGDPGRGSQQKSVSVQNTKINEKKMGTRPIP